MDLLTSATQNLLTPPILFFLLGVLAGLFKSDLEIPESISRYLSIYLMMAIGFKGGVALASAGEFNSTMLQTIAVGLAFGFIQPVLGFYLLRLTSKLDVATSAAVAAHYGSISIVTFATAVAFLDLNEMVYAGYIVAVLALMEAPAIVSGIFLAYRNDPALRADMTSGHRLTHKVLTNGAVLLLLGAFVIGAITGESGMARLEGFLVTPFQGILTLFLLDMGLLVARNARALRQLSLPLVAYGIYMPAFSAVVGAGLSALLGLDTGTALLFMVLLASASYIAVPAAMRMALPSANPAIYLPLSLAVTFPFNILIGIPLYYKLAVWVTG
jgi:hypothetical protein